MNQYIRPFNQIILSTDDIAEIKSMIGPHDERHTLQYHGYLNARKTLRTSLGARLRQFAAQLDLRVAGIYAFTARAGTVTTIHADGDTGGRLPWRLAFYAEGEPGVLTWHDETKQPQFENFVSAYVFDSNLPVIHKQRLDFSAAFVRTDIPHRLDTSENKIDRLTITATFKPYISWEELNTRLDSLNV